MFQVIDKEHGCRPVCRDCRRKIGPPDRKVWRCLDCQIKRARQKGDEPRLAGLEFYRYATEGR